MEATAALRRIPHIKEIQNLAQKKKIKIWLVGGFLRDSYLKASGELTDFDFCVEENIEKFLKELAKIIQGKMIILDKRLLSFRIISNRNKNMYTYDFSLMRGANINEDLLARDFTINTLAVRLDEPKKTLDFYGAKKDLLKKRIRTLSEAVLIDDPVRILRGFSFSAQYGFKIESKTLRYFCKHKAKIRRVSAERINEELFKVFLCPFSYKLIRKMDKFRVIDEIMPHVNRMRKTSQGGYHHLDVWLHSIETLKQFELLCKRRIKKHKDIVAYLNEQLAIGRKRIQVLKIACLLHDLGKPFVKRKDKNRTIFHTHEKVSRDYCAEFAAKLRLSKNEGHSLQRMVFWHLRPGYLADQVKPSSRAVYRFFRDTQKDGPSIILLSLADWRATRGPLTNSVRRKQHEKIMLKLLEDYFSQKKKKPLPKIINGHDIMTCLGLGSGPLVGKILDKIREMQMLGKIEKKSEALNAAKKILTQKAKKK